jgi:hypothetical protein
MKTIGRNFHREMQEAGLGHLPVTISEGRLLNLEQVTGHDRSRLQEVIDRHQAEAEEPMLAVWLWVRRLEDRGLLAQVEANLPNGSLLKLIARPRERLSVLREYTSSGGVDGALLDEICATD